MGRRTGDEGKKKKGRERGWKWGSEAEPEIERRQSQGHGQRERGEVGVCLSWEGLHGCGPGDFVY